jgi:hypothetical protein
VSFSILAIYFDYGRATPPSSQLIAISIMLGIPSLQLRIRHSDQLMCDSSILLVYSPLLPDSISPLFRDEIDPEVVINATGGDAGNK